MAAALASSCTAPHAAPTAEDTLHIVALNDFHGALYEQPDGEHEGAALGGLPFLKGALDALRAEHPDALVLDGGDLFQGSWPVNASQGLGAVEAYNLLGVDAAAVGNHEFDYGGKEGLSPLLGALEAGAKAADFAWLAANIDQRQPDGAYLPWRPEGIEGWTVLERGGRRVGVIGLSTVDTPQTTLAAHVAELRFNDVVRTVEQLLPLVEAEGVDVIALVAHLSGTCEADGTGSCTPHGELERLATELPPGAVDVIVSGHTHTGIAARIADTLVVQNFSGGTALGHLELAFTDEAFDIDRSVVHEPWVLRHRPADPGCGGDDYDLSPQWVRGRTVKPSPEALALVRRLEANSGNLCAEVGCSARVMTRDRRAESEVGNLVADAIHAAYPQADLAIANAGGLRADLPMGTLRREHIQALMPFDNRLVVLELSGAQLRDVLAIGLSGQHGFLQLSGATAHLDPARTTGADRDGDGEVMQWETDRLCSVQVAGQPLDPARTYTVVTSDFLASGGDHLGPAMSEAKRLETGALMREQLFGWFEQQSACVGALGSPIDAAAPRIRQAPCAP
jgi:5'-nucleotidase